MAATSSGRDDGGSERNHPALRASVMLMGPCRYSMAGYDSAHAEQAERAVLAPLPEEAVTAEQFTFLGTGWTVGLAHEAALKLREASGAWTESYAAMEYRHGPISIAGPGRAVWFFGAPPSGLLDEVRSTGAYAAVSPGDPLADLVRAQRLAVALAERRGLDPDRPRNLTRSVVLPGS